MDMEEVAYRLKMIGEDSDFPVEVVVSVIGCLPNEVASWALDNLWFLCPSDCNGAAYTINADALQGVDTFRIVYIAARVFEESEAEQRRVIAHEIAHHWLRHKHPVGGDEYERREREVEPQIAAWGFN